MRKNLILFLIFALSSRLVWSQYYISLDKENTFHYGNSYLINIPLNIIKGNLFIEDLSKSIPIEGYLKLWKDKENYSFDSVFVAQKTVHEKQHGKNNAVIYQVDFNEYIIKYNRHPPYRKYIDTLNSIDPKLYKYKYLLPKVPKNKKDSVLIYYTEFYGSGCCPRDPKFDRVSENDFIISFEKKHSVKIGQVYSISMGKEGENNNYFTLSGLTPEQKIQFIDERVKSLYGVKNQMPKEYQSLIYTPYWMSMKDLIPSATK